ncbi:MAG TPA: hypothetical protein VIM79_25625, partial [Niastella sp.]
MEHHHHEDDSNTGHAQHQNKMQGAGHDHLKNPPHGHTGHDHHAMMINDFKRRFYIVLILTFPIMLMSPMIQHWLNIYIAFTGSLYVLFALSSVVFV